jgi:hypothetical protein
MVKYTNFAGHYNGHRNAAVQYRAHHPMEDVQPSVNLSGGQRFLALDTGKIINRNSWKELPLPLAVINPVNVFGCVKRSMLVFTDCLGQTIGKYTPTVNEAGDEDKSAVNDLFSSIPPAPAKMPGVSLVEEGSADDIPGVGLPDIAVVNEPTGVDMSEPQVDPPQDAEFNDAVFDMALDDGLEQQTVAEPEMLPMWGWWHTMLGIGSSQRSITQACKVTSTKLHWLRLLLPSVQVRYQWYLPRCLSSL